MAPSKSPKTGTDPEEPPAWAAAFMLQVQNTLDAQAVSLRSESDSRQQQIDAALASVLPPTRSSCPLPSAPAAAPPPAPARAAAGLAFLFEKAADSTPGAFQAALEMVVGPGVHAELQAAVESGDLAAASALLQGAESLSRSTAAGGGGGGDGDDEDDGHPVGGRPSAGRGLDGNRGARRAAEDVDAGAELQEEADNLLDQLEELEPGTADSEATYADAFRGYPLPLPSALPTAALPRGNPFPIAAPYSGVTGHYHPGLVGDPLHGALADRLELKGFKANARELRTLLPTLRAMVDLRESLRASAVGFAAWIMTALSGIDGVKMLSNLGGLPALFIILTFNVVLIILGTVKLRALRI